jgi:pimeloyl-ACP methyl ester carboxylesterase
MGRPIDEGLFVAVNGLDQWLTLRGRDLDNPPLMILPGAGAAYSVLADWLAPWEEHFTLVQWDQPGSGRTLAKAAARGPGGLSLDRLASDGIAAAEAALARLGHERLALLAISMGSCVGLKMVWARPDLFFAYVANGQVTNWRRQEALCYRLILEAARARESAEDVAALERIGPPPWADLPSEMVKGAYANAPTRLEEQVFASAEYLAARPPPSPETMRAALDAFAALRGELAGFDADALGPAFDVPVVFLQGAADLHTPTSEVKAFARRVQAPKVVYREIKGAGHLSSLLREQMLKLLKTEVRPLAFAQAPGSSA